MIFIKKSIYFCFDSKYLHLSHRLIIELNVNLSDAYRFENHSRMTYNIFGINVFTDFELYCTYEYVTTQRPEMGFLNGINASESRDFLITARQHMIKYIWLTLHQHHYRFSNQRQHTKCYENCDEHAANWIGNHPAEKIH